MSTSQPYDTVRREDGSAIFSADLPAFASIGRRYDELYDAYYRFQYPREYLKRELEFVQAMEVAGQQAASGGVDWIEINDDLARRFGAKYRRLRSLVPSMLVDAARLSQQGLVQCIQNLVTSARGQLARKAKASDTSDDPTLRAAAAWQPPPVPNPLESPQFRAQMENWKTADPNAGERIAGIMRGLSMLGGSAAGGASREQQMDEQMKALGQSPAVRAMLEQQRQLLERIKQVNPAAARAMERQVEEMERMSTDPTGFRAELAAQASNEDAETDETENEGAGDADEDRTPGRFHFDCGAVRRPTEHQKQLFTWLVEHQQELAPKIEKALRATHAEMAESVDLDDPNERVIFPENSAGSDVPLSYFRIESIMLPEAGDRIGITLDSVYGHEEHGCALVIAGGEVIDAGGTDVLAALDDDEFEDEDFDDYDADEDDMAE
jgi:hypothetical protein